MRDFSYWAKNFDEIDELDSSKVLVESIQSFENQEISGEYSEAFSTDLSITADTVEISAGEDTGFVCKIEEDLKELDPEASVFTGYNAARGVRNTLEAVKAGENYAVNGEMTQNPFTETLDEIDTYLSGIGSLEADGFRAGLYAGKRVFKG